MGIKSLIILGGVGGFLFSRQTSAFLPLGTNKSVGSDLHSYHSLHTVFVSFSVKEALCASELCSRGWAIAFIFTLFILALAS